MGLGWLTDPPSKLLTWLDKASPTKKPTKSCGRCSKFCWKPRAQTSAGSGGGPPWPWPWPWPPLPVTATTAHKGDQFRRYATTATAVAPSAAAPHFPDHGFGVLTNGWSRGQALEQPHELMRVTAAPKFQLGRSSESGSFECWLLQYFFFF
jgi:hypothetical protein